MCCQGSNLVAILNKNILRTHLKNLKVPHKTEGQQEDWDFASELGLKDGSRTRGGSPCLLLDLSYHHCTALYSCFS